MVIFSTNFRDKGATISIVGKATTQLLPHATIQDSKKSPITEIVLKVEIPDTTHDIIIDKIKINKIGVKREEIIIPHL